jgi:ribulose-phosphate 3-epimerase
MKQPLIAPSILSANLLRLQEEVESIVHAGADWVHVDVMDGRFVPNITFGPGIVAAIKKITSTPIDVHLMITPAQPHLRAFAEAGADIITIHPESDVHLHRSLMEIRAYGRKAGVALNPHTPLAMIESIMADIDLILIMAVNPGWGGQKFISHLIEKIRRTRHMIDQSQHPILLEVDGGIVPSNAHEVIEAGADVLVAGTAIFQSQNYAEAICQLKGQGR